MNEKKRWLVSLAVIAAVVITSAAIIFSNHPALVDIPRRLPVTAISDGSGGVIVTWHKDSRIYTQRINHSGQPQWGIEGVLVAECPSGSGLSLTSDSLDGVILSWQDNSSRPDSHNDPAFFDPVPFYCQRINADGEILWSDSPVSTGKSRQIVPDGNGGIILAWNNYSTYYKGLQDDYLRLQKIAPDGRRLWGDEGILVVASSPFRPVTEEDVAAGTKGKSTRSRPTYEGTHYIVSDGAGGVFVFWDEEIATREQKIYAQRIEGKGNYVWPERVTVAEEPLHSAASDGKGGAIVKTPEGTTYSRIGKIGTPLAVHINGDGELLETEEYDPTAVSMSDGTGGSFSLRIEEDPPYGPPQERRYIPWIQRLDASGQPLWEEEKRVLPSDEQPYGNLKYLADGSGGVIITWGLEKEVMVYSDIRARKLDTDGEVQWGEAGIPVFEIPDTGYQKVDAVLGDGSGGAIIIAVLGESAIRGDMAYAQRLDENGNRLWGGGIRIDR